MKTCHIGFSWYPGIGSVAMYEHSQNLAKLGVDVQVIAAGRKRKEEEMNGLHVFLVESPSVTNLSLYPLLFVQKVSQFLRRVPDHEFDIVHVYHFPGACIFPLFFRKKGRKWIFFTTSGPVKGGIISRLGWAIQTHESRLFDHLILRDPSHVPQFSYRDPHEITIVPIGADLDLFRPGDSAARKELGIDEDTFLFAYAGNLNRVRKIETLIDALRLLGTKKVALLLVGDGGTERVRLYARATGMEQQVILTGGVPYEKVAEYMRCGDVFLSYVPLTPEFDTQPPLKTVEALACGLPVIASDTRGNRRFVTHNENGFLVQDDAHSVYKAMDRLMKDENLRDMFAHAARPSVSNCGWRDIVKNSLLPAYERILTEG
ncbi:MAG: glycosyltransferase family 4 protein [Theionarchaea archaeon]|nr:glycosyltransferase family 4 protein [Theionarchaea archaeon]MBU7038890.1 glycosyltransferase family 4 protein [Theionarchaea archaeon]